MIKNVMKLKIVAFFISLFLLRIFLLPVNVIDIISSPQKYMNKTVRISGVVTAISPSYGKSSKYHYLRGDRGGVILLYASEEFRLKNNCNYNVFGIVGYNINYNEPFLIVSTIDKIYLKKNQYHEQVDSGNSNIGNGLTEENNNNFKNNEYPESTDSVLSEDSVVSFLKNSRISEFLLDQIGTQIIRIIHITCSHQSTALINRSGDRMRFETIYKGLFKKHKLVWMIELSKTTIISDFNFISDTNKFPSAKFVNTIKETIIKLIKENLK